MRTPAQNPARARKASVASFPSPTDGWISNQNLSAEGSGKAGATVLDNWWPTPQNVMIRRGQQMYCQVPGGSDVHTLMSYSNGGALSLIAGIGTSFWDATDQNNPMEVVSGLSDTPWSWTQFATTGGVFLVAVNGKNSLQLFDGSHWWPIGHSDILQVTLTSSAKDFIAGEAATGATSGATMSVLYQFGNALYGTAISGTFKSGETITGSSGGSVVASADSSTWWAGITGNETSNFSAVFVYMDRLFFIEKNSLNLWYLTIDSIGGVATIFPMAGVFTGGGSLMFGAGWSLDNSGQGGLSEQCAIFTDAGEVAIYQGVDPSLSTSWAKVGQYRIDKPRGPRAFVRNGGDILVATDTGLLPLSQAIQKSFAQLAPASVSYPIDYDWNQYVQSRSGRTWEMTIWPENQMLIVALPNSPGEENVCLVANMRTGAWARFTNWFAHCLVVHEGQLYLGADDGSIIAAWQTGADMGVPYTASFVPLFSAGPAGAVVKLPRDARLMMRGAAPVSPKLTMQFDYVLSLPTGAQASIPSRGNRWDVGVWDQAVWSGGAQQVAQNVWVPVAGRGAAFAPCLQVTSGDTIPLDNELVSIDVTYVAGGLLS
ncbi:MAG: hypothetical protein ABF968_04820 [Acetobacter sp.]|uniref:hypothetical protein n=1 Tax=Acetobacter sp. TaxID=440 RepID=UPI0039E77BAB